MRIDFAIEIGGLPPTWDEYEYTNKRIPRSDAVSRSYDKGFYDAAEEVWAAAKPKVLDDE